MDYIDHNKNRVVIGRQVGRRGGEGSVFEASSHPGHVVKIYHETPDDVKGAKLWHFCQLANQSILSFAAWPRVLVWDGQQKLRGFIMPVVQGKEVHQLFGPKERFIEFPGARWDFLIRVARNCAAAFEEIHNSGVVVGDVNEGNILVKRDGTIALIDCDSYQAKNGDGYLWTCDVGVPLWTPPELQNQHFRGLHRVPNHDLFGLALLIFKLLFMGRHAFAGTPLNAGEFDLEKQIADYKFAFSERAASYGMKPPPNCLPMAVLPKNYRDLFERAFSRGSERVNARPTALEWRLALEQLEKSLKDCGSDSSHRFPSHISSCPWCEIASKGGPNFFITVHVTMQQGHVSTQIWAAITKIAPLTPTGHDITKIPLVPCKPSALPAPDKAIRAQFVFGVLVLLVGVMILFGGSFLFGLGVIVIAAGMMSNGPFDSAYSSLRVKRTEALNQTAGSLQLKISAMESLERDYMRAFTAKREELRKKYERLTRLEEERKGEVKKLEAKKQQFQLDAFLDRQLLNNATIPGIGPKKLQTLLAYNIESALDVPNAHIVPGIGNAYFARLMDWRRKCEAKFRFNPNQAIPPAELHNINVRFANIRKTLESELAVGANHLQQINNKAAAAREPIQQQIEGLIRLFSQCRVDLDAIPKD